MAADLSKADRTIKKEPTYKTKPKYCLLVFGPEAKTRVWVVIDGDAAYVDRNGNGDLTEPGKRVQLPGESKVTESDGKTKIELMIQPAGTDQSVYCEAAIQGRYVQYAFTKPVEHPRDAPIYHFHAR
jgi:hypothetical protein